MSIILKPSTVVLSTCAQHQVNIALQAKPCSIPSTGSEKKEITMANCISLMLANTSTNVVKHNSIKSRALRENKSIFIAGCNCQLVHIAAGQR